MVDWCHTSGNLSTRLNYRGYGGRVPPERKSLESGYNRRLPRSWHHGGTGSLDVHEGYRLGRKENEDIMKTVLNIIGGLLLLAGIG